MRKNKVLFLTEASYLNTGYATYGREVLTRLSEEFEVAEFSVYGSAEDPRRKSIPWKSYANMPSKDNERHQQVYNSSPANQFGAWRFERACLDFEPDIVLSIRDFWMDNFVYHSPYRRIFKWCFPAGTPVVNDFGSCTNIEDVKIGDFVLSHTGKSQRVSNVTNHVYSGEMVKIKAEGMAEPLVCTEDHEVLVVRKAKRKWNNEERKYDKTADAVNVSSKEFVPASDINAGDYLMLPVPEEGKGVGLSSEDLWVIGHFLADGSSKDEGRISFAFNEEEKITLDRVVNYFNNPEVIDRFSIKTPAGERRKSSENGMTWRLNSSKANDYYSQFYDNCGEKILPQEFKNLTNEEARSLLEGYFAGDGCKTTTNHGNPSLEMFSKSKVLARQIAELFRRLGVPARLKNRQSQHGYTIRISGHFCNGFDKELSKESTASKKDFTRVLVKDGYVLMPVHSIEMYEDELTVYDIEVENDHSFLTHCAVHNCWMPTVDAAPQNIEWVDMFANADYILSYSDWAGEVLKEQGGDKINFMGSAPPSASELLRPIENVREEFGIPEDWKIIGTVMRNQRRKLFPSLFEAFSNYIKKTGDTKTYLYCHTSYPDMGWNLGELLHEHGISSRVLFSYLCQNCGFLEITPFNDARKVCSKCGKYASAPASVGHGVDTETLAKVYNIMDLYVQCANSEGFGLPQVEAAACGTPIACTDYSAMKDVVKYLGAHPIKLAATYKELETGCERAVPCVKSMEDIFEEVLSLSKEDHKKASNAVRTAYENSYGWDRAADTWAKVIRESGFADWRIPANIKPMVDIPTGQPSHSQFLEDLKRAYVYTPDHLNSHFIRNIHTSLLRGTTRGQMDGYYFSEFSPLSTNNKNKPATRSSMVDFMKNRLKNYNIWETVRMDRSQLIDGDEPWLN